MDGPRRLRLHLHLSPRAARHRPTQGTHLRPRAPTPRTKISLQRLPFLKLRRKRRGFVTAQRGRNQPHTGIYKCGIAHPKREWQCRIFVFVNKKKAGRRVVSPHRAPQPTAGADVPKQSAKRPYKKVLRPVCTPCAATKTVAICDAQAPHL